MSYDPFKRVVKGNHKNRKPERLEGKKGIKFFFLEFETLVETSKDKG